VRDGGHPPSPVRGKDPRGPRPAAVQAGCRPLHPSLAGHRTHPARAVGCCTTDFPLLIEAIRRTKAADLIDEGALAFPGRIDEILELLDDPDLRVRMGEIGKR